MSQRLFIVHGWAYSIEPWSQTAALLRKQNIDVVQLRVPGLTSKSDEVWTIDGYVDWLSAQLEGEDAPVVLGHSNGGRIALHFAATYPGRLRKLILLNSAGVEIDSGRLSMKRRVFQTASKALSPLKHVPLIRKVVYRLLGSDYGSAPENMQKTLANMLASDRDFDASAVETPTVILWGSDDRTTPPQMARILHAAIQGSTLQIVDDWQHAPYKTHPDELAEHIVRAMEQPS